MFVYMNLVRFNVPSEEYGATLVSNTHLLLLDKYRLPLKKKTERIQMLRHPEYMQYILVF